MLDDTSRRQLRFSLFLQGFAALMLGVALVVRVTALGWDLISAVFLAGLVLILVVGYATMRRLRSG